jgi:hypothetical protein
MVGPVILSKFITHLAMSIFSLDINQIKEYSISVRYSPLSKDKIGCVLTNNLKNESTTIVSIIAFDWERVNTLTMNETEWVINEFLINPAEKPDTLTLISRINDIAEGRLDTLEDFINLKRGKLAGKRFGF